METVLAQLGSLSWTDVADFLAKYLGEIVVALILSGLAFMYSRAKEKLRLWRFQASFGANVASSSSLLVSLPLWSVAEGASRATKRFRKVGPAGQVREYYGPTATFATDDILGVVQISDLFSKYFPKPVQIVSDNERVDWSGKTVVLVGSNLANFHTAGLVELLDPERKGYLPFEFVEIEENDESQAKVYFVDRLSGQEFRADDRREYAMVARVPAVRQRRGSSCFFVVAGIHSTGTLAAATYLRSNWRKFGSVRSRSGVILELARGQPETVRELKWLRGW